ncbi:MAG: hypothetical protein NZ809_05455 [Thermodesulfovibrio sp.]|nr:hypothetical protein [Thermodesulfovibrio sp.]
MEIKYFLYFFIGGIVVSVVTYLASHGKGLLAAFFANLPIITFITFLMIYYESGQKAVLEYAKGLLIMLFPWLGYVFTVLLLGKKLGIPLSLFTGLLIYLIFAYFIMKIKPGV